MVTNRRHRLGWASVAAAWVMVAALAGCARLEKNRPADDDQDAGGVDAGRRRDAGAGDAGPGDAGAEDAGPGDAGADGGLDGGPTDAGAPGLECDPMVAETVLCPGPVSLDPPSAWAFTDDGCHGVDPDACAGADCDDLYATLNACLRATSGCDPALCRNTGGRWLPGNDWCLPFVCGLPPDVDCAIGVSVCNCGLRRGWEAGVGCVEHPPGEDPCAGVTADELCAGTLGNPTAGEDGCACPRGYVFSTNYGCVLDICDGRGCFQRTGDPCAIGRDLCPPDAPCTDAGGGAATCQAPPC